MQHRIPIALCVALWGSAAPADTVTIFRVTAPDGSVTYQNTPPKQSTGAAVEAREIDPNSNVVPTERYPAEAYYTAPRRSGAYDQRAAPSVISAPLPLDALGKGAAAAAAPAAAPPAPPAPAAPAPPTPAISIGVSGF